jgi:hypothetical protein
MNHDVPEYQVVVFDDKENDRMTFTLECDSKPIGKTTITKSFVWSMLVNLGAGMLDGMEECKKVRNLEIEFRRHEQDDQRHITEPDKMERF